MINCKSLFKRPLRLAQFSSINRVNYLKYYRFKNS